MFTYISKYSEFDLQNLNSIEVYFQSNAVCSDDSCPCNDTVLYPGQGYLYINPTVVEFRKDCRSITSLENKLRSLGSNLLISPGVYNPILCCEKAIELRNLDKETARNDANMAWKDNRVPLRITPKNGENSDKVTISINPVDLVFMNFMAEETKRIEGYYGINEEKVEFVYVKYVEPKVWSNYQCWNVFFILFITYLTITNACMSAEKITVEPMPPKAISIIKTIYFGTYWLMYGVNFSNKELSSNLEGFMIISISFCIFHVIVSIIAVAITSKYMGGWIMDVIALFFFVVQDLFLIYFNKIRIKWLIKKKALQSLPQMDIFQPNYNQPNPNPNENNNEPQNPNFNENNIEPQIDNNQPNPNPNENNNEPNNEKINLNN